jgi:predicted RecB family endonuclease
MNRLDAYFKRMVEIFGTVDALAEDFLVTKDTVSKILAMPEGEKKENTKIGALAILPEMKKRVTTNELKSKIDKAIYDLSVEENPSGGRRKTRRFKKKRLMSKAYCKKTPCRRMGFTQKASCRPYKNCY